MTTYTVVAGDTMWRIAVKHGIGLSELLKANPQITNSSLIYPEQVINIPSTTETPSTPSTPSGSTDIETLENEVVRLVNIERSKACQPALVQKSEVSRVARI